MRHLCVYCGSGPGRNPAYMAAARALGTAMANRGIGLVYGGGSLGLMGEVAQSVLDSGGHVVGIIPEFLVNKERMLTNVNELIVTASMHERKMTMFERSDGFVALPGGLGTLEELVEISTWAQLDRHAKPIIICDVDNYWAPLLTLINHMRQEKFIREGIDLKLEVVKKPEDVVSVFEERLSQFTSNVPADPIRKTL
ncbi:TIGR00730 family Rossman fold protein [Aestuariivirga sp. YIM B02566]|uniref:TIGR00730 family Rossman fold protein n=1 Tax=Taklimakanibacter albus TaxID=2800327 RepID=A0ACC5R9Y1_9HYPH|nr:TIGR00730 family Rossman fold protein [Aestuariivirga sp. YIM B02566]MBK1869418.1 TIGR00730 family Rossman fold protein [Aestuariivirga sp. YIM B02566]